MGSGSTATFACSGKKGRSFTMAPRLYSSRAGLRSRASGQAGGIAEAHQLHDADRGGDLQDAFRLALVERSDPAGAQAFAHRLQGDVLEDDRQVDQKGRVAAAHDIIRIQGAGGQDERRLLEERLVGRGLVDQAVFQQRVR